jgi:hypothetical protein
MFRWRISVFGKTPAISLGTVTAPRQVPSRKQAIEFYSIPAEQQFRVVAVKIEEGEKVKVKS